MSGPTYNPDDSSGTQMSNSDEKIDCIDENLSILRLPTQVLPDTQEDGLAHSCLTTTQKMVQQDTGYLAKKSKTALRHKSKRSTRWLSKLHAGLDSIIFLMASVHGASLCFFLCTIPFFHRGHEVYDQPVHDLQVVSATAMIMLLPISIMVTLATESSRRVTRLHHCNPPLLFASALFELLYHLDAIQNRECRHPTGCQNKTGSSISGGSINVTSSTAPSYINFAFLYDSSLVRSVATILLEIGAQWCLFRVAIVGVILAASATPMCRYELHTVLVLRVVLWIRRDTSVR